MFLSSIVIFLQGLADLAIACHPTPILGRLLVGSPECGSLQSKDTILVRLNMEDKTNDRVKSQLERKYDCLLYMSTLDNG